jgi:hypothetical protein
MRCHGSVGEWQCEQHRRRALRSASLSSSARHARHRAHRSATLRRRFVCFCKTQLNVFLSAHRRSFRRHSAGGSETAPTAPLIDSLALVKHPLALVTTPFHRKRLDQNAINSTIPHSILSRHVFSTAADAGGVWQHAARATSVARAAVRLRLARGSYSHVRTDLSICVVRCL